MDIASTKQVASTLALLRWPHGSSADHAPPAVQRALGLPGTLVQTLYALRPGGIARDSGVVAVLRTNCTRRVQNELPQKPPPNLQKPAMRCPPQALQRCGRGIETTCTVSNER